MRLLVLSGHRDPCGAHPIGAPPGDGDRNSTGWGGPAGPSPGMAERSQPAACLPEVPPRFQGSAQIWGPSALCMHREKAQEAGAGGEPRCLLGPRGPVSALQGPGNREDAVLQACLLSAHLGLPGGSRRLLLLRYLRHRGTQESCSSRPLGLVCRASPTRGRVCEEGWGQPCISAQLPLSRRWAPPGRTVPHASGP